MRISNGHKTWLIKKGTLKFLLQYYHWSTLQNSLRTVLRVLLTELMAVLWIHIPTSNFLYYFLDIQIFFNFKHSTSVSLILSNYAKILSKKFEKLHHNFYWNFMKISRSLRRIRSQTFQTLSQNFYSFFSKFKKSVRISVFYNFHQICTTHSQLCWYLLIKLICSWIFPEFSSCLQYNFA